MILYGGIGDTIIAYEGIAKADVNIIYANNIAKSTLLELKCTIPIYHFNLVVGSSIFTKIKNVISVILLLSKFLYGAPCKIYVPSFSKIWKIFPFVKIYSFDESDKCISRHTAILRLLEK